MEEDERTRQEKLGRAVAECLTALNHIQTGRNLLGGEMTYTWTDEGISLDLAAIHDRETKNVLQARARRAMPALLRAIGEAGWETAASEDASAPRLARDRSISWDFRAKVIKMLADELKLRVVVGRETSPGNNRSAGR